MKCYATAFIKNQNFKNMINKFRIFDKVENEYCEEPDYRWLLSRNGKLYNSENDEWYIVGERYIVEFSTGINDNNKTELFEGDICKVEEWYPSDYKEAGFIGEIMFEDGSFFVYRDEGKYPFYQELDSCSVSNRSIIKIGNKNDIEVAVTKANDADASHEQALHKHVITNRTYKCSRCGTEYIPASGTVKVGCCIMPVDHRTSGICGGELIEVI